MHGATRAEICLAGTGMWWQISREQEEVGKDQRDAEAELDERRRKIIIYRMIFKQEPMRHSGYLDHLRSSTVP